MKQHRFLCFLCLAVVALVTNGAMAAGPFVLTDLGSTSGGEFAARALGINAYGQVVGSTLESQFDDSGGATMLWTPTTPNGTTGTLVDLGKYDGSYAVNDVGQVVGCTLGCDPGNPVFYTSGLWSPATPNGTVGSWSTLTSAGASTGQLGPARGINSSGQIAATDSIPTGHSVTLWSPATPNGTTGTAYHLGNGSSPGFLAEAYGINTRGQIVGTSVSSSEAILWSPITANGTAGSFTVIATTGSFGSAINDFGQVAGAQFGHGFLWTPSAPNGTTGTLVAIAGMSQPFGMNATGSIVGGTSSAVLWEPSSNNGMSGIQYDLTSLLSPADATHWQLTSARGINFLGQIVGYGLYDADGPGGAPAVQRAFLLTPVPEPCTLCLLGLVTSATLLIGRLRSSTRRIC